MTRQEAARSRPRARDGQIVLDPALVGAALLGLLAAALLAVPGEAPAPREGSTNRAQVVSTFP